MKISIDKLRQILAGTSASLQCNKGQVIYNKTSFLTNIKLNKVKKASIRATWINIVKKEGLYQTKVNSGLKYTCNCEMYHSHLPFHSYCRKALDSVVEGTPPVW